jgi:hypothetical protein
MLEQVETWGRRRLPVIEDWARGLPSVPYPEGPTSVELGSSSSGSTWSNVYENTWPVSNMVQFMSYASAKWWKNSNNLGY